MIVEAAFEIARVNGLDRMVVKEIADRLGCSVQPIYSYCDSMEGLKRDLMMCAGLYRDSCRIIWRQTLMRRAGISLRR